MRVRMTHMGFERITEKSDAEIEAFSCKAIESGLSPNLSTNTVFKD